MGAAERSFKLCGGNLRAFEDTHSREYLISGAAGTGKTLANLLKILKFGQDWPGARMLILRKTRHSLTETALVTWERDVLGAGHPMITPVRERMNRHEYKFPVKNGARSVLVTAGLDKPDKVLSSEWDLIYVPEATDLELTDWETLGGRLRAMAGPYDQLFGDCNPTTPHHWLKKRCDAKKCRLYESKHHENPRYYDAGARKWTEAGIRYVKGRLLQMTGMRRKRFLLGLWAAAEGVVYAFDPDLHQLPRGWVAPREWPRVWSIDWGKTSPTVLQMWAVDPRARMHLYREFFRTNTRPDVLGKWAKKQIESGREPHPLAIVCDHDQERKADFENASALSLDLADKADRDKGIEATQSRFDREVMPDGTLGGPRIFFAEDALDHEPDPNLEERGTPSSTIAELTEYRWDEDFLKDEPIAENDHGMDAMRYAERWVSANLALADPNYRPPQFEPLLPARMGVIR